MRKTHAISFLLSVSLLSKFKGRSLKGLFDLRPFTKILSWGTFRLYQIIKGVRGVLNGFEELLGTEEINSQYDEFARGHRQKRYIHRMLKTLFMLIVLVFSFTSASAAEYFSIPVDAANVGPVTQANAEKISADLIRLYFVEAFQKTQKPMMIQVLWEMPYFGAGVVEEAGPVIAIKVFGGMIRNPEMTEDILAAVMCHEIGHVIGGAPYQDVIDAEWTSVEGQSDFFAASKCLPRYFQMLQPRLTNVQLKQKIELAALGFFLISQKYATPDQVSVSLEKTAPEVAIELNRHSYPSDQCRLDTFKAGAACLTEATCRAPVCWLPK